VISFVSVDIYFPPIGYVEECQQVGRDQAIEFAVVRS
jgi:hypothetical protein